MISSGGTSAWMICIAMGIILSISSNRKQAAPEEQDKELNYSNPIQILSETH